MQTRFIWLAVVFVFCVLITGFTLAESHSDKNYMKLFLQRSDSINNSLEHNSMNKSDNVSYIPSSSLQDKFELELLRLRAFREKGTLEELLNLGSEIEHKWSILDGNLYAKLSLEFLSILTSNRYIDEPVIEISRNYAGQALKRADTFDLKFQWKLLLFLGNDSSEKLLDKEQLQLRRERVEFWLHAFRRLENEKDPNFNPNDLPQLNIKPPHSVNLQAGVSPDAINDIEIRAKYEKDIVANSKKTEYYNKQHGLRQDEAFFIKKGVDYISAAYSKSADNLEELESLLAQYKISWNIQEMLKAQITSNSKQKDK